MQSQNADSQSVMTPKKALDLLVEGNRRFVGKQQVSRDLALQVQATGAGQWPFAVVLGCIDSRAPAELVFDQGIGDIFNVRIAGNFVNTDILGSMEFACRVAGARLVMVLGHTSCGAVKGACDHVELGNLTAMLKHLEPALEAVCDDFAEDERSSTNAAYVQAVAESNVEATIGAIRDGSEILREMEAAGEIAIVGAMYDVGTGRVDLTSVGDLG